MSKVKENLKEYFRHDYHARNHLKFKPLRMSMGLEGLGIYWCVVEMLYEEGGVISKSHYDSIAFDLHIDKQKLVQVVEKFGLFSIDDEKIFSEKVLTRLKIREDQSKKRAKAAKKRWNGDTSKRDAIAFQVHYKSNAIIEENSIVQNSTEKNKKVITLPFGDDFKNAWSEWHKHRSEIKKKLTPSTEAKLLKKLAKLPEQTAIAMIEQSIENGWQGIFPVKSNTKPNQHNGKFVA